MSIHLNSTNISKHLIKDLQQYDQTTGFYLEMGLFVRNNFNEFLDDHWEIKGLSCNDLKIFLKANERGSF